MNRRKWREKAIILCISLVLILLGSGQPIWADELPTITVAAVKVEQDNFAGEQISRKLDEYVAPLIGAHVRLEFIEVERFSQIMDQYSASNNMPDIFLIMSGTTFEQMREEGKLLELSDLLETEGKDIIQIIPDEYFFSFENKEGVYAVPCVCDRAHCYGFEYRKEIAERYQLPMEQVKELSDLTAIFADLKQKNPEAIPCSNLIYSNWDEMGDQLGVLMGDCQTPTVKNLYETLEFQEYYRLLYAWEEKGYLLDEDLGYQAINSFVSSPEIFGKLAGYHPALLALDEIDADEELGFVPLTETVAKETDLSGNAYAISSSCLYPEQAMKFLNLMFSDAKVVNLLCYGIEGEHYKILDKNKGVIDYAEGVTRKTSTYSQFRTYHWGNQNLAYLWNGFPEDLWEKEEAYNRNAPRSLANGFHFDKSTIVKEYEACRAITARYLELLEAREGDVEILLKELNEKLKEAGIDQIIKEKQIQLNAYLEGKES